MKRTVSDITKDCLTKSRELYSIFDDIDFKDNAGSLVKLKSFFEKLAKLDCEPPDLYDYDTEYYALSFRLSILEMFRKQYLAGNYAEAACEVRNLERRSNTLCEPSIRAMLLTAWEFVNRETAD